MKSVAVLGGGESGVAAALLARKNKLEVFVSDYGTIADNYKKELKDNNISFEEGGHDFERLVTADIIVKSPGIPEKSEIIKNFRLRQKEIISEIEFASRYFDGKILAITGSNGKTTTASLVHHLLLQSDLKVGLGGNIGFAFSRMLCTDENYDWVVLELSSFQLDDIKSFSADLGMLLNITPDHLDRYDYIMQAYASAKWKLMESVDATGNLLLNADDEWTQKLMADKPVRAKATWVSYKNPLMEQSDLDVKAHLKLKGQHNLFNATMAAVAALKVGVTAEQISSGLESFKGIPFRLESFELIGGVEFIDDSKATNIESVVVALDAMSKPIIWIVGGVDKGNDYDVLSSIVDEKVKTIICLTKDDIKIREAFGDFTLDIFTTENVDECVAISFEMAEPGDVVLLSPACASFDLFSNYIDRGNQFKRAVRKFG